MAQKDYRELQLTSTQLALIFIAILALGVVIFLLGVSVGKKQAVLTAQQSIEANLPTETLQPPPGERAPATKEKERPTPAKTQLPSSSAKTKTTTPKSVAPPVKKSSSPTPSSRKSKTPPTPKPSSVARKSGYYVQVGAYSNRNSARILAEKLRAQGYPAVVLEPFPTDRRPLYRVRVGAYATRAEALRIKDKLARATGRKKTDYFIVQD